MNDKDFNLLLDAYILTEERYIFETRDFDDALFEIFQAYTNCDNQTAIDFKNYIITSHEFDTITNFLHQRLYAIVITLRNFEVSKITDIEFN